MKTVLVSVFDKTGLVDLLRGFQAKDSLRLVATGSTAAYLTENGFACETVESVTGFPEILDGRVKTLHPKVFGGILAKATPEHQAALDTHAIPRFDIVIVNLYPFAAVVKSGADDAKIIENIDIGGVALIRAAAKNFAHTAILCDPSQYESVQEAYQAHGDISVDTRKRLASEAFTHTAKYDSLISAYFFKNEQASLPETLTLQFSKVQDLRYGENPHQQAAWYQQADKAETPVFTQTQGKELSANNILDTHAAIQILREFPKNPACCIIKHNNPCGVAIAETIDEAYDKAYAADPISAFGGIFGFNQPVTATIAEKIKDIFIEIVVAPSITPEAQAILAQKKNVRVLLAPITTQPHPKQATWLVKDLEDSGLLLQETTMSPELPELQTVTQQAPSSTLLSDIAFGWAIVKHLTSNAIAVVKDGKTLGLGTGQTSRIASVEIALKHAGEEAQGAVLASDGFFPATDNIDAAAKAGITVIVQPGGSIKDADVIEAANQHGLAMVLTGERCFKH